ncbi:DUF2197 domain-containing protein [Halobacillus shinanisalinarum]|uniref:DUF2197 domain-containing protein n=1 Tax=Halobacillus shinanisalinarum TaxID=2932258 RepID=A0ABY4GVT4_9BACI|nr:DUF2197 domain-containing protein [Halobacillus shinanisalinarum]UOQ92164.1 DUF2197 domain-containing protein [Halobacillus shinanisalinarum]
MLKTICFFCKKKYTIDRSDTQYQRILKNPEASYVCKSCNQSMQKEAQTSTGLNPGDIDKYDKYLR